MQDEGDAIVRADLIEDPAELNQRRLRLGVVVAGASLDFVGGPGELVEQGTPLALPDLPTDRVEGDRDDVASCPSADRDVLGGFEEADEDVADQVLDFCLRPQRPRQQAEDEPVELVEGSPLPIRRAGPDGGEQIALFRTRGPFGRGLTVRRAAPSAIDLFSRRGSDRTERPQSWKLTIIQGCQGRFLYESTFRAVRGIFRPGDNVCGVGRSEPFQAILGAHEGDPYGLAERALRPRMQSRRVSI